MPVCLGRSALESVEKTSALSKYGGDRDGDILGLRDRATKAVIIVPWAAVVHFFALKSFPRLVVCSRVSPSDEFSLYKPYVCTAKGEGLSQLGRWFFG